MSRRCIIGKGAPSAPSAASTAAAQTQSNRETAVAQAGLNATNQITPYGNLTYEQTGTWSDGTPRFTATQTLSGAGQNLLNTGLQTQQNLANVAQEQSGRLSGLLNTPLDWSQQQNYLNDITAQNLDRSWDRQSQQFETDLVNRGIRPGSTQYQQLMGDFRNDRSNAYNNANMANYNTALQSQIALADRPLNQLLSLSGLNQVQQPSFVNSPTTQVAGTDVAGITNANYNQQLQAYNQNQQALGGLFSAGASLIPLLSDIRSKTDIVRVGTLDNGLGVYLYKYHGEEPYHIGLLAQEVETLHPDAIVEKNGLKHVIYDKAVN